jgi:6-pyruvoyltetrahydropterin/6-carboxytetrahydropterin synthase
MYRIGKRFSFEAAHRLGGLPDGHKCTQLHGHSYNVEVVLAAAVLSPPGFVADFADLALVKKHLEENYDHRVLNVVLDCEPTSENLARVLFEWCTASLSLPAAVTVAAVRVSETATTWAEYQPAGMPADPEQ